MNYILGCGDKSGYCIVVQFQKSCHHSLAKLCPRSCKQCTGPVSDMCVNMEDDQSYGCAAKASRGYCQHGKKHKRWSMKNRCARTCCERGELYKFPNY